MTVVYWDEDELLGLVVEPAPRFEQTMRTVATLRSATTVDELEAAELPSWARGLVERYAQDLLLDEDQEDIRSWTWSEMAESVIEAIPLPWDARNLTSWLDADLVAEHLHVGGGSPAGSDAYVIADREAFFAALAERDYALEHRPGLVAAFNAAL